MAALPLAEQKRVADQKAFQESAIPTERRSEKLSPFVPHTLLAGADAVIG